VAKKPVLFQLSTALYLGLVCFNPAYETLRFVLEKREFFEVEWPALVTSGKEGLMPILIGIPVFTVQRCQLLWYTLQVPESLLSQYKSYIPHIFQNTPLNPEPPKPTRLIKKGSSKTPKIIPFPLTQSREGEESEK